MPGVYDLFRAAVTLNDEPGFVHYLRLRRQFREVPHHGGQNISPGCQVRSDVQGLVTPVVQIAARGTLQHAFAIHEELIAVVAAHMDHKALRNGVQCDSLAEMKNPKLPLRPVGMSDPRGFPEVVLQIVPRRLRSGNRAGNEREGNR